MNEHLDPQILERLARRAPTPDDLLAASAHLPGCRECRERIGGLGGRAPTRAPREPVLRRETTHLRYEGLAALLSGGLPPEREESARSHLAQCPDCAADLADLRSFRAASPLTPAPAPPGGRLLLRLLLPAACGAAAATAALVLGFVQPLRQDLDQARAGLRGASVEASRLVARVADLETRAAASDRDAERLAAVLDALNRRGREQPAGEVSVADLLPDAVRAARRGELRPEVVPGLESQPGRLMGAGTAARLNLLTPVNTAVLDARPRFAWTPLQEPGVEYRVAVGTPGGERVAESPRLTAGEWRPGSPLPRSRVLLWQVTAFRGEQELGRAPLPEQPEARFLVLPAGRAAEIHLTLGVAYSRAGLMEDAERELRAYQELRPGDPATRRLLESLRRQPELGPPAGTGRVR